MRDLTHRPPYVHDRQPGIGADAPAEPGYPQHAEQRRATPDGSTMHSQAEHAAHDKHAGHSIAMFQRRFWVSLALTLPTLVWGHMLQRAFGYTAPHSAGAMWIPPVFGTTVFVYGGWVFSIRFPTRLDAVNQKSRESQKVTRTFHSEQMRFNGDLYCCGSRVSSSLMGIHIHYDSGFFLL